MGKIDIETPEGRKSCHVSRQASTASASTSAGQEQDKEEKEKEKEKEEEKVEEKKEEEKEKEVVINEEKKEDSAPQLRLLHRLMTRRTGLWSLTRRRPGLLDSTPVCQRTLQLTSHRLPLLLILIRRSRLLCKQ